ncbi:D-glycero-beta-D-manno-heptose 1-phosphate adenylyltransferase [Streptomyces gobiensis]|uniref:D-glycero-beta-D-manno-heptose 1-phosphate adenylyltransferase n=1 Tax=Streptomyces gobiensis TaxID=2875706 RepID=UPI001E61CAA6|nr:D-glycero-beta-D-manno-heptose 1-phosphate adenylyltransferase [Streptomyces gobiensis]UGY91600.1 D-glycero-beta-D-manno-heptose 1-phosphate adenylyltransferase [Streptomyces gobiensis]
MPPDPVPLVIVGDALLDRDLAGTTERLAPDAPIPVVEKCMEWVRPGGAALAALMAARDGRDVTLVTALGGDPASCRVRELLARRVTLVTVELDGTLVEKTRVLARGRPVVRVDRGDGRAGKATDDARSAIEAAGAVLVADYGRGTPESLRGLLARVARRTPVAWDPHPRGGRPVPGARLVTPTIDEARHFARASQAGGTSATENEKESADGLRSVARHAGTLARAWAAASVAVTLGEQGVLLSQGGSPLLVPAPEAHDGDSCGAGDRFAVTAAGLLGDGALPEEAVRGAVSAATAYVADGGPAQFSRCLTRAEQAVAPALSGWRPSARAVARELAGVTAEAGRLVARVRARGGTVVAAGGCFDLLHPGHIGLLESARELGDCLIVCLNSDASVRRRKGEGRPITPLDDRIRVLRALKCVDAVAVFDEDTPETLLSRLRPDIWVKGSDYALADLPEAAMLERWGGHVLMLPYREGHSTTRIAARMRGEAP